MMISHLWIRLTKAQLVVAQAWYNACAFKRACPCFAGSSSVYADPDEKTLNKGITGDIMLVYLSVLVL